MFVIPEKTIKVILYVKKTLMDESLGNRDPEQ